MYFGVVFFGVFFRHLLVFVAFDFDPALSCGSVTKFLNGQVTINKISQKGKIISRKDTSHQLDYPYDGTNISNKSMKHNNKSKPSTTLNFITANPKTQQ
jgi:hypothetical protein